MSPQFVTALGNHLWQSTLFAGVAILLATALSRNHPKVRYGLWMAASIKFLIPFSVLVAAGSVMEWRSAPLVAAPVQMAVEQIGQPFAPAKTVAFTVGNGTSRSSGRPWMGLTMIALWAGGSGLVLTRWFRSWLRIRGALRAARPVPLESPIPVMSTPSLLEPGIFGVIRPVLLLPDGIPGRLAPEQFQAILVHEMCHVRRRDNLAAAMHMGVEAAFWFHPLVWWIGARLVEERERACDEEVVRTGSEPQVYAEGILNVCKFYLESPLACASGVTGADLKKRIEAIMSNRISERMTMWRKALLAGAGVTALALPFAIGMFSATQGRAQSNSTGSKPRFEVASVKPGDPSAHDIRIGPAPGGGLRMVNVTVKQMVSFAYDVRNFQVSGGPSWAGSERFEVVGKPEQSGEETDLKKMSDGGRRAAMERNRLMLRTLLEERFQLKFHKGTKEVPVYALVVGKDGPKMKAAAGAEGTPQSFRTGGGRMTATRVNVQMLTNILAELTGRPVLDETGLKGFYDFDMEWTPEPGEGPFGVRPANPGSQGAVAAADPTGPSLYTAIQQTLGLKLESKKGPVETLIIDHVEKPTEN